VLGWAELSEPIETSKSSHKTTATVHTTQTPIPKKVQLLGGRNLTKSQICKLAKTTEKGPKRSVQYVMPKANGTQRGVSEPKNVKVDSLSSNLWRVNHMSPINSE
jgi:hypothetical protein